MAGYNNFYTPYQYYPQQYQQQQSPQIQSGGFIPVKSIEEAYNWPVAPGNSITFKDENSPYVYTKTKGFSPLEPPVFERYRLVKEEDQRTEKPAEAAKTAPETVDYSTDIKTIYEEIDALKKQIKALQSAEVKEDE